MTRKKKELYLFACTSGHSQSKRAVFALRGATEPGDLVEVSKVGESMSARFVRG